MEFKKRNEHFTADVVLTEAEVQSLVGVFEHLALYMNRPVEDMDGLRAELYKGFRTILRQSL